MRIHKDNNFPTVSNICSSFHQRRFKLQAPQNFRSTTTPSNFTKIWE